MYKTRSIKGATGAKLCTGTYDSPWGVLSVLPLLYYLCEYRLTMSRHYKVVEFFQELSSMLRKDYHVSVLQKPATEFRILPDFQ